MCATWPELQRPASGSHSPQTLPDGFIYNSQSRGSTPFLFLTLLPTPGARLGRPFPLRKPAGDGNVLYCSAQVHGHCLSPRWQQQLTVWVPAKLAILLPAPLPPPTEPPAPPPPPPASVGSLLNGWCELVMFTLVSFYSRLASSL